MPGTHCQCMRQYFQKNFCNIVSILPANTWLVNEQVHVRQYVSISSLIARPVNGFGG